KEQSMALVCGSQDSLSPGGLRQQHIQAEYSRQGQISPILEWLDASSIARSPGMPLPARFVHRPFDSPDTSEGARMNDVLTAPHHLHRPGLRRRIALLSKAVLVGASMVFVSPACAKVELLEHAI